MSLRGCGYVAVTMPLCRSGNRQPRVLMPAVYAEDDDPYFVKDHVLKVLEYMREKEHGETFPLPSLDPDDWNLVRQGEAHYTIEPA